MKIIDISFYSKEHEELLKSSPKFNKIQEVINSGLLFDEDLWIYALFKEQKNRDGFRSFDDFKHRLSRRITLLEDYIDFDSKTITAIDKHSDKNISEYIGVGTALKLISTIHDLIEADWEIIPESQTKDLDFEIGFDDKNTIEVECKGTFNGASRYDMKKDIIDKKTTQRKNKNNNHLL